MITFAKGPDGSRVHVDDAASRLEYTCFVCGAPLIPHKGDERRHHFKHKGSHACTDTWSGTYCDSVWHLDWQKCYPPGNREITLELGSVRHRADVVVGQTIVEFQHSALTKGCFDDRNAFYGDLGYKVVWLYDLRETYGHDITPKPDAGVDSNGMPIGFQWNNPREAFRAYDPAQGDVDLFLQLGEDECKPCIVRVLKAADTGFEEFETSQWFTAEGFLAYTGLRDGVCATPDVAPLESCEEYLRFKRHHSILLDAQQERAAQVVDGATLLLAVPGSGKTTTMVARLGYLTLERGIDPRSIIAVTYGKGAAAEMRHRFVSRLGNTEVADSITFSTINALCKNIYHDWCDRNPNHPPKRTVIDEKAAKRLRRDIYKRFTKEYVSEGELTDLATRISWVKNRMLDPREVAGLDEAIPHFTEMYGMYCSRLKEDGKMDFDDQMRFAKYALEHDDGLLTKYRQRYRYWCVDEAQDTSRIQHYIIRMLAGPEGSGNVFMVGDEDQSIYGYRGAYPKALLSFSFDYPNARTLRMETNYRSGEEIVSAASKFIGRCKGRIEKHMVSWRGPGSVVRVEEVARRLDQFDAALRLIHEHQRTKKGTLAVIYRNNETAVPLIDSLVREGIAFSLSGKANTFFTSPSVRDIKAFMRLSHDSRDAKSFMQVYSKGSASIVATKDAVWSCKNAKRKGTSILDEFVAQMSSYRKGWQVQRDVKKAKEFACLVRSIASLSPLDAIERLLMGGYGEWLEDKGRSTRTVDLLKPIARHEKTISSFMDRLEFLSRSYDKGNANHRVSKNLVLTTAHSCKGCEFDSVVIIDAIEGLFPSERADPLDYGKDEARNWQEERRLFYVAMTRARNELILVRAADERTPFVDEVRPRPAPVTEARPAKGDSQASPASLRAALRESTTHYVHSSLDDSAAPSLTPRKHAPKPVSAVSRYDVSTWEVLEDRGLSYRRVANGDMTAELTDGPAGKTVDLWIPWACGTLLDVADHLDEFACEASDFVVHADATGSQLARDIKVVAVSVDAVELRLEDERMAEASSKLVRAIESLEEAYTFVVLSISVPDGVSGERRVQAVDEHSQRIFVDLELYEE